MPLEEQLKIVKETEFYNKNAVAIDEEKKDEDLPS